MYQHLQKFCKENVCRIKVFRINLGKFGQNTLCTPKNGLLLHLRLNSFLPWVLCWVKVNYRFSKSLRQRFKNFTALAIEHFRNDWNASDQRTYYYPKSLRNISRFLGVCTTSTGSVQLQHCKGTVHLSQLLWRDGSWTVTEKSSLSFSAAD